jgi:hypothetical protein
MLPCMGSGSPPDQPAGFRWAPGGNGGGFFRGDDPQALAALRDTMGDEVFERIQLSRELHKHPRPLTDVERRVLRETVAPLLRDLAASGMSLPDIREEAREDRGDEAVCAWIQGPGVTGEGISIWLDSSSADQVAELAEQIQNWAADKLHDAGHPPEWPRCPEHPTPHRLSPEVRDSFAVWICPESRHVIWAIGGLV